MARNVGQCRVRDVGFPINVTWSIGSSHWFDQFPDELISAGLHVSVRWEGGDQVIEDGAQYVHSIGVYALPPVDYIIDGDVPSKEVSFNI